MDIYASYEVQIQGTESKVMARIAYTPRLLNSFLNEMRNLILNDQNHAENDQSENKTNKLIVVGVALILYSDQIVVMQLCFGTYCVIIQTTHHSGVFPESLKTFLCDEDIAFVGVDIWYDLLASLKKNDWLKCMSIIELRTLADRVCRTNKYSHTTLEKLASEVGIGFEVKKFTGFYGFTRDLSNEQIEYATITAYASYLIGCKLLTTASGGRTNLQIYYNFSLLFNTMDIYASYEVQIKGTGGKVMARIAYTPRLLNSFLNEMRSLILNHQNHAENDRSENITKKLIVVGVALILRSEQQVIVMQLCFGTYCVIIQMCHYSGVFPESLKTFLSDEDIAFVGVNIWLHFESLKKDYGLQCMSIDLGTLADRIYRTNKYSYTSLEELANEVGIGFEFKKLMSNYSFNRDLRNEQIEYATITAYASYLIGCKLLTTASEGRK